MTSERDLIQRLTDALADATTPFPAAGKPCPLVTEALAYLAQPEAQGPSDVELLTRIETLEAALHKHIMQTSSNAAPPKVLDLSDLPQLTPEQMQNLQDLLGTYRNHLGLND